MSEVNPSYSFVPSIQTKMCLANIIKWEAMTQLNFNWVRQGCARLMIPLLVKERIADVQRAGKYI